MIVPDQPTIFDDVIVAAVSSRDDGNMKFGIGNDDETRQNRVAFLRNNDIEPSQTTLLQVTYDTTDFCRYHILDDEHQGEGMLEQVSTTEADAVIVTRPDHAVFLPLADCVGAIVYDTANQIMMVSHLGRHSVEQGSAQKSIHYLIEYFETDPSDLLVWLSPAVGNETYPLHAFDGRGLHDIVTEQFTQAGVDVHCIETSQVDTAQSDDYYSHSEFKAGNRDFDGHFAIVAMMRE
jgi:copper oxidase (laccase) domain-containing protein